MTVTNVTAVAVNTIDWLSAANTNITVPVYQRQYRWDVDGCAQLLADIRAVANGDARQTHFVGSILYTVADNGDVTEWMLVDGQQRIATLVLLVAALRHTLRNPDNSIAGQLDRVLLHPTRKGRTRLRLHNQGARELDSIIFGGSLPDVSVVSHLRDNFDFFLEEVQNDSLAVWEGLQRLEHVAITLQEHANPQQVFESLNSTGKPLRNHELIHNYVLMGLSYAQQTEIEDSAWIPIETNTGDALDNFFRDYLILRTGRDSEFRGERGVFDVFKNEFPSPNFESLSTHAAEWKAYSEVYRVLLEPSRAADEEVRRHLGYINTFGTAMYPLLLGVYRDYQIGTLSWRALVEILEQLQSLYLRKMVVGADRDHLAAQLCRKRRQYGYPIRAIAQRTPSDERVREALAYRPVPLAEYVLDRIDEPSDRGGLQIEHIFPQFPRDTWSGDGDRQWSVFSEMERAKYREILPTIGNLALLEPELNAGASNKSFLDKKRYYEKSKIGSTRGLARTTAWDLPAIAERTRTLTEKFLEIWKHPSIAPTSSAAYRIASQANQPPHQRCARGSPRTCGWLARESESRRAASPSGAPLRQQPAAELVEARVRTATPVQQVGGIPQIPAVGLQHEFSLDALYLKELADRQSQILREPVRPPCVRCEVREEEGGKRGQHAHNSARDLLWVVCLVGGRRCSLLAWPCRRYPPSPALPRCRFRARLSFHR